ncbi:MAG TPA: LysE family translocator [Vicinamibacterales bacterium]|jgi:threonine/homoserine/homoserine lactone efflux protein|nr:LysE family translocator [Vicinamibacterales bacterium]
MIGQLFVVVSVTCLAMVIPGPDMVLVLRNTVVGGRRAGLQTSCGVLTGNLVHITYCLLGIGWLISRSIVAFAALKYAFAGYLIYLGIRSLRSKGQSLDAADIEAGRFERNWILQGFVNNVLNPKGTLFYLGVFTVVIAPGTSAGTMLALVCSMMLVSASFWLLFVSTLDRPVVREWFARSQRNLNRAFGGLLILLGVRVAFAER